MTFVLLALTTTTAASLTTYFLARTYMLQQREDVATRQGAECAARLEPAEFRTTGARAGGGSRDRRGRTQVLVHFRDRWYTSAVSLDPAQLPDGLSQLVEAGSAACQ